jgi:small subunit ribosomal protein S4e
MSHLTRQEVPREWPIPRKGSVYVVRPDKEIEKGIPILILLRDVLKLGKDRKEIKKIIHDKKVIINNRFVRDEKENVLLFDVLKFLPTKEDYRLSISNYGKFYLQKIDEKESDEKISKIIGKKILKGKKIQINFLDGNNILSDLKFNIDDSAIINLKDKKIKRILPMKEGSKIMVYSGKHIGKIGEISSINKELKMAKIKHNNQEINVLIKQIIVIG